MYQLTLGGVMAILKIQCLKVNHINILIHLSFPVKICLSTPSGWPKPSWCPKKTFIWGPPYQHVTAGCSIIRYSFLGYTMCVTYPLSLASVVDGLHHTDVMNIHFNLTQRYDDTFSRDQTVRFIAVSKECQMPLYQLRSI